jgi:hypothetical protein
MSARVTGPNGLKGLFVIGHAFENDVPLPLKTFSLSQDDTTICGTPVPAKSPAAR